MLLVAAGSMLAAASQEAAAFAADACLVARGGTNCTANDGSIASVALNTTDNNPGVNPSSCTAGSTVSVDLEITLSSINANNRFDLGLYVATDGKSIAVASPTGATSCSVLTTPPVNGTFGTNPPYSGTWSDFDGNACGDLDKANGLGTLANPAWKLPTGPINVLCTPGAGGNLLVPIGLSYRQNTGTCVTPATDVSPGTSSKCNYASFTVPITVVEPANTVTLTKVWTDAVTGDQVTTLHIGGTVSNAVDGSSTAPSTTTNATADASPGANVTLSETLAAGNVGSYTPTLGCTSNGSPVTVTNGSFTMPSAGVICTFTNTGVAAGVTLTKTWVNAVSGDSTTLDISGTQVSGAIQGNSTAPSTTTDATATAVAGSTVTLSETLNAGNQGSYTTGLACTSNGSPVTVTNGTITMPGAAVSCTFTNTGAAPAITLTKTWVNAVSGDSTTLDISGTQVSGAIQGNSTAPSTTTNATATAVAGSTVTLSETLNAGNQSGYSVALACTSNGQPVTVTNSTITMPAAAVSCTFTNTAPTPVPPPVSGPESIPTVGKYALLLMMLMLAALGVVAIRRSRR